MKVAELVFWLGFLLRGPGVFFVAGWEWCILLIGAELMALGLRGMHAA